MSRTWTRTLSHSHSHSPEASRGEARAGAARQEARAARRDAGGRRHARTGSLIEPGPANLAQGSSKSMLFRMLFQLLRRGREGAAANCNTGQDQHRELLSGGSKGGFAGCPEPEVPRVHQACPDG